MAWVKIQEEVSTGLINDWNLCFQKCTYNYDDGNSEDGYRFIWRKPNGNLQAARGQARIPSCQILCRLLDEAREAGWFHMVVNKAGE